MAPKPKAKKNAKEVFKLTTKNVKTSPSAKRAKKTETKLESNENDIELNPVTVNDNAPEAVVKTDNKRSKKTTVTNGTNGVSSTMNGDTKTSGDNVNVKTKGKRGKKVNEKYDEDEEEKEDEGKNGNNIEELKTEVGRKRRVANGKKTPNYVEDSIDTDVETILKGSKIKTTKHKTQNKYEEPVDEASDDEYVPEPESVSSRGRVRNKKQKEVAQKPLKAEKSSKKSPEKKNNGVTEDTAEEEYNESANVMPTKFKKAKVVVSKKLKQTDIVVEEEEEEEEVKQVAEPPKKRGRQILSKPIDQVASNNNVLDTESATNDAPSSSSKKIAEPPKKRGRQALFKTTDQITSNGNVSDAESATTNDEPAAAPKKTTVTKRKGAKNTASVDVEQTDQLETENVTKRKRKAKEPQPEPARESELEVSEGEEDAGAEIFITKRIKRGNNKAQTKTEAAVKVNKITKRKADANVDDDASETDDDKPATKTKKTIVVQKTKEVKVKVNSTETDFSKIQFNIDKEHTLKIVSWNVAGLRALVTKGGFEYFDYEKPDIICLQEIKCLEEEVPEEAKIRGYHPYWFSKPGGRGGVAILSKIMPHNVEHGIGDADMDEEGRIITAEYEKFYLVCVYVPNAGNKLVTLPKRLRWNKLFEAHLKKLNAKKPVIICGDMNVAHTEIDLANPKTNTKNAGFTIEERNGMSDLLALGFVDTFRDLYPKKKQAYTFWSYRGNARPKNVGWRLDYCITSERLKSKVVDNVIRSQVLGSDHCPLVLFLNV